MNNGTNPIKSKGASQLCGGQANHMMKALISARRVFFFVIFSFSSLRGTTAKQLRSKTTLKAGSFTLVVGLLRTWQ